MIIIDEPVADSVYQGAVSEGNVPSHAVWG